MRAAEPHPQVQEVLNEMADADLPPMTEMSVEQARAAFGEPFVDDPDPIEEVTDRTIPGPDGELRIRVYDPAPDETRPVVTFFHGGGFVVGDLDSHDPICRALANAAEAMVVAVEYRLAPEHPFPAAVEDAYAATEWIADNAAALGGDGDQLAVAGDSAGGNLAAVVALLARDRDGPDIDHQVLIYPTVASTKTWPSHDLEENVVFDKEDSEWLGRHYIRNEIDAKNPYAAPIRARDHVGLPSATVVTAGFDIIRDEGIAYAGVLAEAGVDVSHHHYDDVVHTFIGMLDVVDRAREAMDAIADDLAETFDD